MAFLQDYMKANPEDNSESSDDEGSDSMVHVGDGFYLHKVLYGKLYAHQRAGVLFLWKLYQKKRGGVLADDMGFVIYVLISVMLLVCWCNKQQEERWCACQLDACMGLKTTAQPGLFTLNYFPSLARCKPIEVEAWPGHLRHKNFVPEVLNTIRKHCKCESMLITTYQYTIKPFCLSFNKTSSCKKSNYTWFSMFNWEWHWILVIS